MYETIDFINIIKILPPKWHPYENEINIMELFQIDNDAKW